MIPFGDAVMNRPTSPPRATMIGRDPHFLAYITPEEAAMLRTRGGGMGPDGGQIYGPHGVPAYFDSDGVGAGGDGPGGPNDSGGASGDSGGVAGDAGPGAGGDGPGGPNDGGYGGPGAGYGEGGGSDGEGGGSDGGGGGGSDGGAAGHGEPTAYAPAVAAKPAGPSPEELARRKLEDDRQGAAAQLRGANSLFGDDLYSAGRERFMGYYTGRINADRNATRDATMRGLDPEIQATPLAHSLSRGVDMAADEAINGLVPAWAAAEAQMRASSGRALADALGRVQSSNDPWADVTGERAGLDQLAEAQRGALPEFSYSPLAPSQAAYGASAFASPTPDEQAQQARLRRLLASLPQAPATRVVGR